MHDSLRISAAKGMSANMSLRLIQVRMSPQSRAVAALYDRGEARIVQETDTTVSLANTAIEKGRTLEQEVHARGLGASIDLAAIAAEGRLLPPIDHPDSAHLYLTGTGLTHLGSAEGRDKMHREPSAGEHLSDSMKMFQRGLQGGKPPAGEIGVQPEWFYKGDGSAIVASGQALESPAFALDGSEEPEICGIYLIGPAGRPYRLGFCLANEFSDHTMERRNYLDLAHSKLRAASLGAELLTGELPRDLRGTSRISRAGKVVWEKEFLSGEDNMSHSLRNLEHHHFRYRLFRRPGDVHVHFFGTATLSCTDGFVTQPGDVFEIEAAPFRIPLCNGLSVAARDQVDITVL